MCPYEVQGNLAINLAARAPARHLEVVRIDFSHRYCSLLRLNQRAAPSSISVGLSQLFPAVTPDLGFPDSDRKLAFCCLLYLPNYRREN